MSLRCNWGPAMINFSDSQNKTISAGITVLFAMVLLTFVGVLIWGVAKALSFVSTAVTPVIVGMFLALLFKPYYEWYLRRFRNPSVSLLLMLLSIFIPAGLFCWFAGSLVTDQFTRLIQVAPKMTVSLSDWFGATFPRLRDFLLRTGGFEEMALFIKEPAKFSKVIIDQLVLAFGGNAAAAGMGLLKYFTGVFSGLLALIFFVFFLTRPSMRGEDYVKEMPFLKPKTKDFIAAQINTFFDILVSFFQRQVVICLIEGILYGTGFWLVGLPYGFVLGFTLGVLNLVPFLGSVTCLPIALPLAFFVEGGSLLRLILVLSVWLCGQILDGYVITPKIQGKSTGLGYAGVIFSFLLWGTIFQSFLGMLLAIPLSAFFVVFWRTLKARIVGVV